MCNVFLRCLLIIQKKHFFDLKFWSFLPWYTRLVDFLKRTVLSENFLEESISYSRTGYDFINKI